MDKVKTIFLENKALILPVIAFLIGFYIQHIKNIQKIESLENRQATLEQHVSDNYKQLDQLKLDKQTFETYLSTINDMKGSINEIQKDIKTILAKGKY